MKKLVFLAAIGVILFPFVAKWFDLCLISLWPPESPEDDRSQTALAFTFASALYVVIAFGIALVREHEKMEQEEEEEAGE